MDKQNFKLGFRNASSARQLEICDDTLAKFNLMTDAARGEVDLASLQAVVATAHESRRRIGQLRAELKQEIASHKTHLRAAREEVTRACLAARANVLAGAQTMQATGLPLRSPWRKVGVPAAPLNLTAMATVRAGEIQLRWKRTVRRCLFKVEMTTDPRNEKSWRFVGGSSQQTFTLPKLVPGREYWFRVRAVNIHGSSPWSRAAAARPR